MIKALRTRLIRWFETVRRPAEGLIAAGFLVTGPAFASAESDGNSTAFPGQIQAEASETPATLFKTGETQRNFFWFPIYRMAHYCSPGADKSTVLDHPGPKSVVLVFQRGISGKKLHKEFQEVLKEAVSSQVWERIKASASIYAEPFLLGSTQKGDRFTVEWIGLDTIVSYFNGRELAKVENQEFARALWSVWVGPVSVVDRDALLALLPDSQSGNSN